MKTNPCLFIPFVVFCHLPFAVFSQNYLSITVSNGDAAIKYFPPAKAFASIFYFRQLPPATDGHYVINLDGVVNKELGFSIDNQDVYVYAGLKDTIHIFYDVVKKSTLLDIFNPIVPSRFQQRDYIG